MNVVSQQVKPIQKINHVIWIGSAFVLFCLGFFFNLTHGINLADESWFLQVIHRMISGEVLYRDIFFGVTSLSVYITEPLVRAFGTEILVVKLINSVCFVFIVLLSCRIAGQLQITKGFPFLLLISLLVFAPPLLAAPYQTMANLFFLACFTAVLDWNKIQHSDGFTFSKSLTHMALLGILSGLCFASKQNIGFYAFVATLAAVVISSSHPRWDLKERWAQRSCMLLLFLFTIFLTLLPIWWNGGFQKFLDYGFLNKENYLRFSGISYFEAVKSWTNLVGNARALRADDLWTLWWGVSFLFPFFIFPFLFLAVFFPDRKMRIQSLIVLLFVAGAFVGIFPRVDQAHLTYVFPQLLIGLVYGWHQAKLKIPQAIYYPAWMGTRLWLGIGVCILLGVPLSKIYSGKLEISSLPHFRGVFLKKVEQEEIESQVKNLHKLLKTGDNIFFLTPYAGFYYLVAGLNNPTPFDYPLVTGMGRNGEEKVIEMISKNELKKVCFQNWEWRLSPLRLEQYVEKYMKKESDLGFCILYSSS